MFNAHYESLDFIVPPEKYGTRWYKVIDTDQNFIADTGEVFKPGSIVNVQSRSIILLKHPKS